MRQLTQFAVALVLGAAPAGLHAEPIIYATAGAGTTLVKIDVNATGAARVVTLGTFGVPGADAIAINAKGEAYTVTHGWPPGGDSQLARVNLKTGVATPFGPLHKPENFMGLGFAPDGTLYAIEPTALHRVDPMAGKRTLVKALKGLSNPMGLTIDHDGTIYAADHVSASPIVRIDPATGQTTRVVQTAINHIHGICVAPLPALRMVRGDQGMEATWPAWAAGYRLRATTSLAPDTAWRPIAATPVTDGDRVMVQFRSDDPAEFFHLLAP